MEGARETGEGDRGRRCGLPAETPAVCLSSCCRGDCQCRHVPRAPALLPAGRGRTGPGWGQGTMIRDGGKARRGAETGSEDPRQGTGDQPDRSKTRLDKGQSKAGRETWVDDRSSKTGEDRMGDLHVEFELTLASAKTYDALPCHCTGVQQKTEGRGKRQDKTRDQLPESRSTEP